MIDRLDVIWHDLECGRHTGDVPLWLDLAEAEAGPILDVGAGTGRVTLELARRGHEVVALDREPLLLEALRERAGELAVQTVAADACDFAMPGRRFGLIIVPLQTLQLFGGRAARAGFLHCAREHLAPGGLVACAIASDLRPWSSPPSILPLADTATIDGVGYHSQPVAMRDDGARTAHERIRTVIDAEGYATSVDHVIHLDNVAQAEVEAEARGAGLQPASARRIEQTRATIDTTVVMLRGQA